jgi:short-subunit dehydrogenase
MGEIRVNSLFSLLLTKAFLPSLRATARARPTIVVFIGSFSDETPMARIVVYSATKHFDRRVALGLHADERFDTPDDKAISFMYVGLATVTTQLTREPPNFGRPSSELFAEKLVGIFGCGRQVVIPYIGHYLARLVFTNLPEFLLAKALDKAAHEHVEKTIRESKSQS